MKLTGREIKIVQIIKENPFISSNKIADILNLSEKTVRTCINSISFDYGARIESKRGRGYYLTIDNNELLKENLNATVNIPNGKNEREKSLICSLIKDNKIDSSSILSEEWFVSEKTVTNDINKIKDIVNKYHLSLERSCKGGYNLVGDELYIRDLSNEYNVYDIDSQNISYYKKIIIYYSKKNITTNYQIYL